MYIKFIEIGQISENIILINISSKFYRPVVWIFFKYFSKKRDLSDSQGGDERKKVNEGSSASSTGDTDVFDEGLESADCKAI